MPSEAANLAGISFREVGFKPAFAPSVRRMSARWRLARLQFVRDNFEPLLFNAAARASKWLILSISLCW